MFDLHIHTRNSHDSTMTPTDILDGAFSVGLSGIALTDHTDFGYTDTYEDIRRTVDGTFRDARAIEELSGGKLTVLRGVELGGFPYDKEGAQRLVADFDFDVVLGSVHQVIGNGFSMGGYSCNFSAMTEEQIYAYLDTYFDRVTDTVSEAPIDVLAHLTYPIRYMNGKHKCGIDVMRCRDRLHSIFRVMIERGIALEVNTSSVDHLLFDFVPSAQILKIYRDLGGRLLTLGSDSHGPDRIGKGFAEAKRMLLSLGFHEYHYFLARHPVAVPIGEVEA